MSSYKLPNGDDYPSAAQKNLNDATALSIQSRHDGSAYLAGYAVECALKTVLIIEDVLPKDILHHRLNDLSQKVLTLIGSLSTSRTARYFRSRPFKLPIPYADPPSGWKETLRYRAEGTMTKEVAEQWLSTTDEFIKQTIIAMAIDGVITW
jgi:hypothetical protein